jgi:hypothetical protein
MIFVVPPILRDDLINRFVVNDLPYERTALEKEKEKEPRSEGILRIILG